MVGVGLDPRCRHTREVPKVEASEDAVIEKLMEAAVEKPTEVAAALADDEPGVGTAADSEVAAGSSWEIDG